MAQEERDDAKGARDQRKTRLHDRGVVVAALPLGEHRPIVEHEPRGLLGDVDLDCSAGKRGGRDQSKLADNHVRCPLNFPTCPG